MPNYRWSYPSELFTVGDVLAIALSGLGTGLSLIVAIGAQNAFVLRQGLRKEHVGLVVTVCALSDVVLMVLGVLGIGALVRAAPGVLTAIRIAGAAFLLTYGALALRRAVTGGRWADSRAQTPRRWPAVLATCLAFTWLNPHVYLDTVLLLGSVANTHGPSGRWWFAAGAGTGSVVWFSALGYGARVLTPLFHQRIAWQILDGVIALVMFGLAIALLIG